MFDARGARIMLACGCRPETDEQLSLVAWAKAKGLVLWWTRSERKYGQSMPSLGTRKGIPDLVALNRDKLAIELKARCSLHKLSPAQVAEIDRWRAWGWTVLVANGARDAVEQLKAGGWV